MLTVTNAVTLDLNGHTLDANGKFSVIKIINGGNLTLINSFEGAGAITGGSDTSGGGVYVRGGQFTMTGGTISGNTANSGGGVYVEGIGTPVTVSGSPVVSGNTNSVGAAKNVYLRSGNTISVRDLSAGATIGVGTEPAPAASEPVAFALNAEAGDEAYFFSDNSSCHVELEDTKLWLVGGMSEGFNDPEGNEIVDPVEIDWLSDNGFTQADIDALGGDAAATDKLYECYLLNCDFRVENAGGGISLAAIAVSNDVVSVTVQLVRTAPLGTINGVLHLYGTDDLAAGFGAYPKTIDFGSDDPTFATISTSNSVTQTATATFSVNDVSCKFFKAAIEVYDPSNQEP